MGIVAERRDDLVNVAVHVSVVEDLALEEVELLMRRELAINEQIGALQERALLRQLLDGVATAPVNRSAPLLLDCKSVPPFDLPVPQNATLAVDERNPRLHYSGVHIPY